MMGFIKEREESTMKKSFVFLCMIPLLFIVHFSYAEDKSISGAEYFIDTDPGEGNANPLAAKDGTFDTGSEKIDMDNLTLPQDITVGQHYLYVRMKDEDGVWGFPQKYRFMVTGAKTIKAAEFFVGEDPGEGQGIPLVVNNGNVDMSDIDTSNFNIGINRIFVRMQNSENKWGLARQFDIEILDKATMFAAEYYIDQMPESEEGIPLDAYDGTFDGDSEQFKGIINTANLDIGSYTLFVRAQDSYQRWSKPEMKHFEVALPSHISGRVFTSIAGWNNLSISNAHVALEGTNYSTTTDENGCFVLMDMAPGDYTLTVTTPDFNTITQRINWTGNKPISLNIPPVERGIYSQSDIEKIIRKYDPSMDNKVSLEEAIHALKTVSDMHSEH
jgi:hypothetical protein